MKYRGVYIIKIKYEFAIDIGRTEKSPVKSIYKTGYSIIGGSYPDSIEGCKASIDYLILETQASCCCTEKEAVLLLNNN